MPFASSSECVRAVRALPTGASPHGVRNRGRAPALLTALHSPVGRLRRDRGGRGSPGPRGRSCAPYDRVEARRCVGSTTSASERAPPRAPDGSCRRSRATAASTSAVSRWRSCVPCQRPLHETTGQSLRGGVEPGRCASAPATAPRAMPAWPCRCCLQRRPDRRRRRPSAKPGALDELGEQLPTVVRSQRRAASLARAVRAVGRRLRLAGHLLSMGGLQGRSAEVERLRRPLTAVRVR